ncbi:MAG: DUF11 domain-containing protein [Sedimentisphaerales bacterium]|nr:DUF11 domain-containing protein [Sedimentisphaerales bacterium]
MKKILLRVLLVAVSALIGGCSCESYYGWKDIGPVPEEIAHKAHWSKECKAWAAPLLNKPKAVPEEDQKLVAQAEPHTISQTFPSQGAVRLEKTTPKDVQLGDVFDYSIKVTNLTDMPLEDVVVVERVPNGFNFTGAIPSASKDGATLRWSLGSLGPNANEEIKVSGMATSPGSLTSRATVNYSVSARADVRVLQAVLELTKTAPAEVLLCEPIPVKYVVKNTGNCPAENVTVVEDLPEGLLTQDGKTRLSFDAGTLDPNQVKEFSAVLKATRAGAYITRAVAASPDGLSVESEGTTTAVRQPVLSVSKEGPQRQYLGRSVTYEITVANLGDGPAQNTVLEDALPTGVASIVASEGGAISDSKATWQLGTIPPNYYKKVSITYSAQEIGELSSIATATAYCASKVTANAQTSVVGVPAILLEVVDVGDPIEVGGQGTYIITATNQGSTAGTNIQVVCEIEDRVKCVSVSGATSGTVEGNKITFAPLPSLAPRTKAIWQVVTQAEKAGDVLFKVSMTTGEFSRAVEETESTNLYQ